jgi:hypothetical protein
VWHVSKPPLFPTSSYIFFQASENKNSLEHNLPSSPKEKEKEKEKEKKRNYSKQLSIQIIKPYHLSLRNTMPPLKDKLLSRMGAISTRALSDGAVVGIVLGSLLIFGGAIFVFCVSVRGRM